MGRELTRGAPERLTAVLLVTMAAQASTELLFPDRYRDARWIRATWFGNDWVTLAIATPLLVASIVAARRGSSRAVLVWLGTLAYAGYNYAFYLFGAALNVFFLFYVCALVAALAALLLGAARLDPRRSAGRLAPRTRAAGGGLLAIGVGLGTVWIVIWAGSAFAGRATPVAPEAFKIVAALDLTLVVPLLCCGGTLLLLREPLGYFLSAVAGVQGTLYLFVLSINSWVAISRGLAVAPGEVPLWGALAIAVAGLTAILLRDARGQFPSACEDSPAAPAAFDGSPGKQPCRRGHAF